MKANRYTAIGWIALLAVAAAVVVPGSANQAAPPSSAQEPQPKPAQAAPLPPPWQKAPPPVPKDADPMTRDLHQLGRIATCMVDGELVKQIVTERAKEKIFHVDPRDKWAAGDNFDVNHEPYTKVKQTLQRIAMLVDWPVDCNLYMPCEVKPEKWYLLIRQQYGLAQMWQWGQVYQDPIPEMVEVLKTGRREVVTQRKGWVSVLTPVYDSLGKIVAVVEVCTREDRYGQPRN